MAWADGARDDIAFLLLDDFEIHFFEYYYVSEVSRNANAYSYSRRKFYNHIALHEATIDATPLQGTASRGSVPFRVISKWYFIRSVYIEIPNVVPRLWQCKNAPVSRVHRALKSG